MSEKLHTLGKQCMCSAGYLHHLSFFPISATSTTDALLQGECIVQCAVQNLRMAATFAYNIYVNEILNFFSIII